ncbi:hypothetical protein OS493_008444 [Desmophyllum pertusum]|uniref:Uncharacterized protein n=1 Tax=Desmophyllum pertusum TaxID=174260 RepID=A0A9X0A457_9CNID|nr:hypothetical protein OS493_008444 [Desmophyllum pertusum]
MKWLGVLLLVKAVLGDQENIDENRDVQEKDLFEGDMRFTKEQRSRAEKGMDVDGSSSSKRGASRFRQWPYGEVYYEIDPSLGTLRLLVTT